MPTYYKSRIYIDLTDGPTYQENYDKLLRWVFDKPLHKRPELGNMPTFLLEDQSSIRLPTAPLFRRAMDAVTHSRENCLAAVDEYLSALAVGLEKFRITERSAEFDELVVKSIDAFTPYRNELIGLLTALARYQDNEAMHRIVHRFLESLIPYLDRPENASSWNDTDFDNLRFIIHELFLYVIACFIKLERFTAASYLLATSYYVHLNEQYGRDVMVPFVVFGNSVVSLEHRNRRLSLNRASLHADMLKERCAGTGVEFRQLMQADFVLFMNAIQSCRGYWWPVTLAYASRLGGILFVGGPFEMFARAQSRAYFDRIKGLLNVERWEELKLTIERLQASGDRELPRWGYNRLVNPAVLLGLDQLAKEP